MKKIKGNAGGGIQPESLDSYGLDISKEIEDILVDELSKSINKQIINKLFNQRIKRRIDAINEIFNL
jgi:hypothetical protein